MQTSALPLGYGAVFGADDEIRTRDLILTKDVRYHLCHISIERGERRFLPKRGIAAPLRGRAGAGPPNWSGLRGSNPLPRPWQGRALPNELNPHLLFVPAARRPLPADRRAASFFLGASGRNRTNDTRIFSPLLYQLSYRGISRARRRPSLRRARNRFFPFLAIRMGLEPTTSSVTG